MQTDRENGMGIGYIKSSEYCAWEKLNRVKISPAEIAVLKSIDRAYVVFRNPSDEQPQQEPGGLFKQLVELDQQNKKAK